MLSADGKKTCARCGERKLAAEFPRRSGRGDGYGSRCKRCRSETYHAWRKANPRKWAIFVERSAKRRRRQLEADPQLVADICRLSRARRVDRREAPGVRLISLDEWLAVRRAFHDLCCYCGSLKNLTIDHLTPVSRGGRTTLGNVAPACRRCNQVKGKLSAEEFRPDLAGAIRRRAWLVKERAEAGQRPPKPSAPPPW
jgi:5-methylcytosine-specific restriction endonuclease McrA